MKTQPKKTIILAVFIIFSITACIKKDHFGKSSYNDILQFTVPL